MFYFHITTLVNAVNFAADNVKQRGIHKTTPFQITRSPGGRRNYTEQRRRDAPHRINPTNPPPGEINPGR